MKLFYPLLSVNTAKAAILFIVLQWLMGSAHAYEVTDSLNKRVVFDQAPQRIVSLLPSLTETVCALNACDKLVGVDRYSTWPAQLDKVPKVGGGLDPNIEAIVALKPDVVLISAASRASERLRALGLKVVVMEPRTHAEVQTVLRKVAQVLNLPDSAAQKVWQDINASMNTAAQAVPPAARDKRVYFEVSRGPYAAGESSFIGETLTRLGMKNVVGKALGPFPKLNPEFVVLKNPDYIMAGDNSMQEMMLYPGWNTLPAVKAGRFCHFNQEQANILVRPGPRMGEGATLMAQCLRGELAK